ncbi:Rubrerythrin [uncultured archaeon]|nr:Rubrerythrin [uncultured archaeon]
MTNVEEMILGITNEEVKALQKELIVLYNMESFERKNYLEQSMKLEGGIIEVVKDLEQQEEMHEAVLAMILIKAGIKAKETSEKLPELMISRPVSKVVKLDIERERTAIGLYEEIISKAGPNLAKVLKFIMEQEFGHVKILERFLLNSQ